MEGKGMKELMLGNKAVARGLYEAGCKVISSYPGTPSTEITEEAAAYNEIYCEWAPNEKVALEVAHGATLGGVRAACAMKHVGLNVAADPLFTISYQGLNAGLVVCVADDPGMHSSQNEQDSRHYAIAAKLPMLEPSDSEESRVFAKKAFEMSEKFNTPVLLKMVTRVAHSQSIVDTEERVEPDRVPYVKDPAKVNKKINSRKAKIKKKNRRKKYKENNIILCVYKDAEKITISTFDENKQILVDLKFTKFNRKRNDLDLILHTTKGEYSCAEKLSADFIIKHLPYKKYLIPVNNSK